MLWFNETKNFGLISTEEKERLYVHRDGFLPGAAPVGRCAGVAVTFNVSAGESERKALDVVIAPEVASKRARSHRRSLGAG
jgi:cold shock CspA family protein